LTLYTDQLVAQNTSFGGDEYILVGTSYNEELVDQHTVYNDEIKIAPNP